MRPQVPSRRLGIAFANGLVDGLVLGGRKGSSYGPREQGRYAAEFYTTVKIAYTG